MAENGIRRRRRRMSEVLAALGIVIDLAIKIVLGLVGLGVALTLLLFCYVAITEFQRDKKKWDK